MTQASSTAAPSAKGSAGGKAFSSLFTAVAIFCAGLGVIAMLIRWFGCVSSHEFSPDLFERRTFTYFEVPLIHWQITPIYYSDTTGDFESYLTTNKYVARLTTDPRWDVIEATRGEVKVSEGAAKILATYFEKETFKEEGPLFTWTKAQPAAAKVFWPVVATVVRDGQYVFLPDLCAQAVTFDDAKKLQAELNRLLAEKYATSGELAEERKDVEAAQIAFQRALAHNPKNADALAGAGRVGSPP